MYPVIEACEKRWTETRARPRRERARERTEREGEQTSGRRHGPTKLCYVRTELGKEGLLRLVDWWASQPAAKVRNFDVVSQESPAKDLGVEQVSCRFEASCQCNK